jgi:hypothetical protein
LLIRSSDIRYEEWGDGHLHSPDDINAELKSLGIRDWWLAS